MVAAVAISYIIFRSPPKELQESGRIFEDRTTGTVFEAPEGVQPARDKDVSFQGVSRVSKSIDGAVEQSLPEIEWHQIQVVLQLNAHSLLSIAGDA